MAGGFDAGAVIGRLELGLAGWKKSVEAVKADQQSLSGFAMRHRDEIEKLGKAFTIVGGAITAALGAAVIKTANFGDEINDMSQRTGIATEILSGYKLAADNSGTSIEGLASGLKLLSRNMFDTSMGTGEAKDAFDFLGISVVNADGTLRDSNEVMLDVADRFRGMENGAQKTALSMDIFGKSGADLIPMLNMGRDGLREAYKDAERFGMIVSQQAATAADEFNDKLGNMKASLQGA
ncbi:MAG: phage tail tape measure protein, partial [Sphaerochaeta sp.]|nr:phage tail tape measure protein [Sphaerochaeta sp.]